MKLWNYITFTISLLITSWITNTAYNQVVRVVQFNDLPLFLEQKCIATYMNDNTENQNNMKDLSIYYSGIASVKEHEIVKMYDQNIIKMQKEDNKINNEMMEIIKEKQKKSTEKQEEKADLGKDKSKRTIEKKAVNKHDSKKGQKKPSNDDTFSYKISDKSRIQKNKVKRQQKNNNIFDVVD